MIFCYTFVIFINIYLIYMCALIATNCLIRLKHNFWLSLAKVPTLAINNQFGGGGGGGVDPP